MHMACTHVATPSCLLISGKWNATTTGVNSARLRRQTGLSRGFTLIELLVAISVMSLLAVLSWRGLDAMARAQAQTSLRADQVLTLQAGLTQWKIDLDSLAPTQQVNPLDWDGRVLRLTRRTAVPGDGLMVVAWMRRAEGSGQWLRWQSPILRTSAGWTEAWSSAGAWAQSAMTEETAGEVSITPLEDWQIFYFRGNAWTNPMSSASQQRAGTPTLPALQISSMTVIPDGIRLVLMLPASQAISGKLTVDWINPILNGDRS